jgi:hypothetical protein
MNTQDYRDYVIEVLADSEASLLDHVVDLTLERDGYRLLSHHLLHVFHDVLLERDLLREHRVTGKFQRRQGRSSQE